MKKLLVVKQQCPDDPHARTADNVELIQIKNIPAFVPTVLPVSFNSQSQVKLFFYPVCQIESFRLLAFQSH